MMEIKDKHTILNKALTGKKLSDVFILDCHGHLDLWKAALPFKTDIQSIIADMDRIGIDMACLNKWNCPDIKVSNDDVGLAVKKYPERIIGFVNTAPSLGAEKCRDELKRCFNELGFKGIKVHNAYETMTLRDQFYLPEHNQAMQCIWEFANEHGCPVLCHGYLTSEIAKRYPEAIFLTAHAGGVRTAVWQYLDCKNVYFDTAASNTMRGNIEYLIKVAGVDRVLYGSDLPYADIGYRIGQVIGTRVNDEQLRKILGENMARLLNIRTTKKI